MGIDEAHEMMINRHSKQAIVRPSKEYIDQMAKYIPHRMKNLDKLKTEILFTSNKSATQNSSLPLIFTTDHRITKSEENLTKCMAKVEEANLLPIFEPGSVNRGLINIFSNRTASDAQRHDLLNFHAIGQMAFENRIMAYVLKIPSTNAPMRKKKLQTFSTIQSKGKKKLNSLKQEMIRVQKCIRQKIAYANKMGTVPHLIGEQYIEQPRAICTEDSQPVKG